MDKNIGQDAMKRSIEILKRIYENPFVSGNGQYLPYLNHYYSAEIQKYYGIDISSVHNGLLHPEWPTWIEEKRKESNGRTEWSALTDNPPKHQFSKYCRDFRHVYSKSEYGNTGLPGHVDFAIGEYGEPEFAIELYVNSLIKREEIGYNVLKLTDEDNPFKYVISFNLILRKNGLTVKVWEKIARNALLASLTDNYKNKQFLFWVVEVSEKGNRSLFIDNEHTEFQEGTPD
jgi:hypothetical protein